MFSVAMAAYNAEPYLRESIESILNQTWTDFELVIVDDGSTDETLRIAREYQARDRRVRVIAAEHGGFGATRNRAVEEASRRWIVIHDADDVAVPTRLEKLAQAIRANPDVIAWGGFVQMINPHGRRMHVFGIGPETREEFAALRARKEPVFFRDPSFSFRRDIALKAGGYDPQLLTGDLDLMDRMSDYGVMLKLPEVLSYYRVHPCSITQKKFMVGAQHTRYVFWRRKLDGTPATAPTYAEFEQWFRAQPWTTRLGAWLQDFSRMQWTRAGVDLGERRYPAFALRMMLAVLANPLWIFNRLKTTMNNLRRLRREETPVGPEVTSAVS